MAPRRFVSLGALNKLGGFAASTVLASVISVATIPVLIQRSGADAWSNLAIGQAVGTILAVVVAFGWGVTGPYAVAILPPSEVRSYYLQSVRIRGVLLVITTAPAVVITLFLVHGQALAGVLSALAVMAGNLSGSWFYVGLSRPRSLFLLDTLPKVLATVVGALLVLLGAGLAVFAACQVLVAFITAAIAVGSALRLPAPIEDDARAGVRAAFRVLKGQTSAVVVAITAALYVSAPIIAVGALAPGSTATYAVGDRILKFSLNGLNPIAQVFQGWVPNTDPRILARRCRTALQAAILVGVLGALVICPLLLIGSPLLTSGQVHLDVLLAIVFALTFTAIAISRIVGLVCLVALQRVRSLAASTVIGAIVGVVALVVFTPGLGAIGAALAFLTSEVAVTVAQVVSMLRADPLGQIDGLEAPEATDSTETA